jgi:hypothetical protein
MGTLCFAGTPDDFFIKALREKAGVEVTNLHLSASAEVKEKRGEQYFTNLAHGVTGNDNRDQVEYWTVQFSVDRNGIPEAEQCRGILRRQAQMTDQQRDVTLDQCERDFRPDMHNGLAVNNQQVELP